MLYDPRPALQKLRSNTEVTETWDELWNELHHQGDVGEASYATVPELVQIQRERADADWNTYAIAATIELARDKDVNPPVPSWLEKDYFQAISELAKIGLHKMAEATDPETVRAILSVIAISKGMRVAARILHNYSEEELMEMENRYFD